MFTGIFFAFSKKCPNYGVYSKFRENFIIYLRQINIRIGYIEIWKFR